MQCWRMPDLVLAAVLHLVVPRRTPRRMSKMRALFGAGEFLAFLLGKIAADDGVPKLKQKEQENESKTNEKKRNGQ